MMWDTLVMQREMFAYNDDGQLSSYSQQSYYLQWENIFRLLWEYDENGNLTSQLREEWDHYYQLWKNKNYCTYPAPQTVTSLDDIITMDAFLLTLSPNPASDYLVISINSDENFVRNVEIINQAGQIVKSFSGNQNPIDISGVLPGIYFVKVSGESINEIQKLIIK